MQKYLVPKIDLLVRDPNSFTPLPVNGALVDWNGNVGRFWRRRVKCGDASIIAGKELENLLKVLADKKAELAAQALKEAEKPEEEAEPETTSTTNRRRSNK